MSEIVDTTENLLEDCRKLKNLLKILHTSMTLNSETGLAGSDIKEIANNLEMYADTVEISLNCLSKIETKIADRYLSSIFNLILKPPNLRGYFHFQEKEKCQIIARLLGLFLTLKPRKVLVTKYRRKVIDAAMLKRLTELVTHYCKKWGCEMVEFNGENDHCHLIFQYYPQMQLSKLVNGLKTYTSMMIRQEFPVQVKRFYWGKPKFWSSAYFIASCGGVTVEILKQYVQSQSVPD